ncbi:hypothetical protein MSG28_008905 [Choristoneura fumiferana]|uniref:Uncharacterized protein n=1 Tax=Choristoneura fumiferana TaxID=7141 RepID=A0ACC0J8H0_CHOFU|nr:hypothetical protein MSG28_008905 [Choristoneura fumiferana]
MDQKTLVRPFIKFAVDFCNELESKTSVCSPVSAEITLALVALGSTNKTHEELLEALGFPNDDAGAWLKPFKRHLTEDRDFHVNKQTNIKVPMMTVTDKFRNGRIEDLKVQILELQYTKEDASMVIVLPDEVEGLQKVLKQLTAGHDLMADIEGLNAGSKPVQVSMPKFKIETTVDLKKVLPKELGTNKTSICSPLSAEMVLALLALGCKNQTREELLLLLDVTDDKAIRSSYKYLTSTLKGIKGTTLNLANKVYLKEGGELKPDEVEGLKSVLEKLASGHNIMADIETMKSTKLVVSIPKFRVETTIDLKTLLPKLGVKTIFDDKKADINMLKSNEKLFVSDAIQKALIIVDENGTEATASTTSNVQIPCCARSIKRFEASHPFLYLLTARTIPLFIGIYEGSEYAEVPSERNDLTEYDMALLKRLSEVLNQRAPLGAPSI